MSATLTTIANIIVAIGCIAPCNSGCCAKGKGSKERAALANVLMDGKPEGNCANCTNPIDWRLSNEGDGETYTVGIMPDGSLVYPGELGHVIAASKGGRYCLRNLRPLCRPCNVRQGESVMADAAYYRYSYPSKVAKGFTVRSEQDAWRLAKSIAVAGPHPWLRTEQRPY